MKTNIIEGNKLIAEFMGFTLSEVCNEWFDNLGLYIQDGEEDLKFNVSWDWLMPVVEKIEYHYQLWVTITLLHTHISNEDYGQKDVESFFGDQEVEIYGDGGTKIEATFNCVVAFIEWYNQNK